jgi:hypothetical protein
MQGHFQNTKNHEQGRQYRQTPADLPHMQNQVTATSDLSNGLAQFFYGRRIHIDLISLGIGSPIENLSISVSAIRAVC